MFVLVSFGKPAVSVCQGVTLCNLVCESVALIDNMCLSLFLLCLSLFLRKRKKKTAKLHVSSHHLCEKCFINTGDV